MGTRCGALDPGVMLYLMDERGWTPARSRSCSTSSRACSASPASRATCECCRRARSRRGEAAIDLFVYRIGRELGSLAAALGGLDAIVFTAGIGEHSRAVRERVCRDAAWLGVELDTAANARGGPRISTPASRVAAWVIPTNEELMIARHTRDARHTLNR